MIISMQKLMLLFFIFVGCNSNNFRSITDGENLVEGNISRDSIYNGLIKFYNKKTKKKIAECHYLNGLKDGEYKQFNENGIVTADLFYKDGKENGVAKLYDDKGNILLEDFYYYGLRTGNSVTYENDLLKSYSFYSLDNKLLLNFDYDSLRAKKLPDLVKNFYYYSSNNYLKRFDDTLLNRVEYFLYTPNPPKQEFNYSLVKVDKNFTVLSTIMEFDKTKPWAKFQNDGNWDTTNGDIAIKLRIIDAINKNNITMFKVLK